MRRTIVAVLAAIETLVACAVFACSLQFSHAMARSHTLAIVAASMLRSGHHLVASTQLLATTTRRIAVNGFHVRITIGDA